MMGLRHFLEDLKNEAPFTTAWLTEGAAPLSVPVAIVDSGIDASHDALKGRVSHHFDATAERPVPVEAPDANNDTYGHGTGVAGLVSRMCPPSRLIDVRVLGPANAGSAAALERGLRWALRSEARIVNLSLATSLERILPMIEGIEEAFFRTKLLVSSRRNLPLRDEGYPAALSAVVGVDNDGALPLADETADYRAVLGFKRGFSIELRANGNRLPSLAPGNAFTQVTGTSFATPVVAGMCAALLSRYPGADPSDLKIMIKLLSQQGQWRTEGDGAASPPARVPPPSARNAPAGAEAPAP